MSAWADEANRDSGRKFVPVETLWRARHATRAFTMERQFCFAVSFRALTKFNRSIFYIDYSYPEVIACKSDSIRSLPQPW